MLLTNTCNGFSLIPDLVAKQIDFAKDQNDYYSNAEDWCFDDIQEASDEIVDILNLLLFRILFSRYTIT